VGQKFGIVRGLKHLCNIWYKYIVLSERITWNKNIALHLIPSQFLAGSVVLMCCNNFCSLYHDTFEHHALYSVSGSLLNL
jgi:hypothetical protein